MQCSSCNEGRLVYDDDLYVLICESCGFVEEESTINNEVSWSRTHVGTQEGTEIAANYANYAHLYTSDIDENGEGKNIACLSRRDAIAKKKVLQRIEQVCDALKIPRRYTVEVEGLIGRIANGKYTKEKWLDKHVGCCVYIVCRLNQLPLTLLDVAEVTGTTIYKLGKLYKCITKELRIQVQLQDPVLLLERSASLLSDFLGSEDTRREIINNAARLVRVAHKEWIDTGRKPATVVGAALRIAAEGKDIKIDFNILHQYLGVSAISLRERCREMKSMILNISAALPWASEIKDSNLPQYLTFILTNVEALREIQRTPVPSIALSSSTSSPQTPNSISTTTSSVFKLNTNRENSKEVINLESDDEEIEEVDKLGNSIKNELKSESNQSNSEQQPSSCNSSPRSSSLSFSLPDNSSSNSTSNLSMAKKTTTTSKSANSSDSSKDRGNNLPNDEHLINDSNVIVIDSGDEKEEKDFKLKISVSEQELYSKPPPKRTKKDRVVSEKSLRRQQQLHIMKHMKTSAPPAFIKSKINRERRRLKIFEAKKRIEQCLGQKRLCSSIYNSSTHQLHSLDDEDLEIERLLLAGVDEHAIENGYFSEPRPAYAVNTTANLNSEEITEDDMNPEELKQYIKSTDEIKILDMLSNTWDASRSLDLETNIRAKNSKRRRIQENSLLDIHSDNYDDNESDIADLFS